MKNFINTERNFSDPLMLAHFGFTDEKKLVQQQ